MSTWGSSTLTKWVVKKFIANSENIKDPYIRVQYGILEGWIGIWINVILFLVKMIVGLSVQSMSLVADSIHTISDSITSIIVIIGFKISNKPSDKEHPFGHGQIEPIATLVVSILLFIVGFELAKNSFAKIYTPATQNVSWGIIAIIAVTIGIKEIMARFSFALGDMINSDILKADAVHHRSDALSTILVVIALIGSHYGIFYLDGIMGVIVSIFICYFSYTIAKDAINPLLGEPPSEETLNSIEEIALSFDGVYGIHDIIFHQYGQTKIISLHIEVSHKENINNLHALSEEIEEKIASKMDGVVVVHLDPINREHPKYKEFFDFISDIVEKDNRIKNFHELRIIGTSIKRCTLVFDICLNEDIPNKDKDIVVKSILQNFKQSYPNVKVKVKVEQRFIYSLNKN